MRRFVARSLVMIGVVVPMLAGPTLSAQAAFDQTPPTLDVPVRPSFVVGNVVESFDSCNFRYTSNIAQLIRWSATDASGIDSYDFYLGPTNSVHMAFELSQETQYTYMQTDYDGSCGGGQMVLDMYGVTARDYWGNMTTKVIPGFGIGTIQEDGQDVLYSGTWTQTYCTCFLANYTRRTSASGARASFTQTYADGDQLALVMAKGPGRGIASIRLDGRWIANVDTFAAANTNRVVVFQRELTAGSHTLSIVNQATAGRPRIDLDAILVNTGYVQGT